MSSGNFSDPLLAVIWEPRRRNFLSSVRAVFSGPSAPKEFQDHPYFRDSWVRFPPSLRAFVASVLWHVVLITLPWPLGKAVPQRPSLSLPRMEVTWYGPREDLPQISPPGLPAQPSPPTPRRGADAFHPRQQILSTPRVPTHPRQTLIQPRTPLEAPKILPQLPNAVLWSNPAQPPRPRLRISPEALSRLRPKNPLTPPNFPLPVPEMPNLEKQLGEINIAANAVNLPKPRLPMAPTSVPRTGPRQMGQDPGAAPDIRPNESSGDGVGRLVALSPAADAGVADLPIPQGNLAARFSISPEGKQPGGSGNGSSSNAGGAVGPRGVSISGGNPRATSVVSDGAGGVEGNAHRLAGAPARSLARKAEPRPQPVNPARLPSAAALERLKSGGAPEEIFGPQRVYTLLVNMPNLSSTAGSWVLSFVELHSGEGRPESSSAAQDELSGPVPLRKVDPKYPPALIQAKIEGEVVLYAIIREDGSVNNIQLVKGVDPQLDSNAIEALSKWKFRPAQHHGVPAELEAIVRIPFRAETPAQ